MLKIMVKTIEHVGNR